MNGWSDNTQHYKFDDKPKVMDKRTHQVEDWLFQQELLGRVPITYPTGQVFIIDDDGNVNGVENK